MTEQSPDIYIVGLGIVNVDQITREAEKALRKSSQILHVDHGVGLEDFLRECCPNIVDLAAESYREDVNRIHSYHYMAARVIDAALSNPPVSFALYGHPLVFAYPPFIIAGLAKHLGLKVKIVPGISAADCIFADLMIDPAVNGLQMFEATDLILRQRPLQPDVPALIWQVGSLETALFSTKRNRPERFSRFLSHILQFYPPTHTVYAVFSSFFPLSSSHVVAFTLSELPKYSDALHGGTTLYIPPSHLRPVADPTLAHAINSPSHLSGITE